ncbi:Glycosyltransferase involved in cell wall bisynthesis [Caldanaerobius fijiensis DSM 17918]|uniref:Glycosyltransferase involved in cell wall bisynthesis n=1 Tax=Caldanaerobius fijiensis DSM 17918 TaxID=1121256 RepID=A0A1M4UYD4_9THEO|nr:glycosyltransferase family 4 protein [Caldanaerobius fijiensis]SHE61660.1 Glycosyltransferase involved in cell wall bisynthesis [Caldanaerobius fijiensis DSM 17918]
MKILIASIWMYPFPGSVSSHIRALKVMLERLSHSVDVVFPDYPECQDTSLIKFYEKARHSLADKVELKLRSTKYDVISCHDVMSFLACLFLNVNAPQLLTVHGYMSDDALAAKLVAENSAEEKYLRYCERIAYQNAPAIIAVDANIRDYIKSIAGIKKIIVLKSFVDMELFKPMERDEGFKKKLGIPDNRFVILCPRRLTAKNGINYLLEAFRILLDRNVKAYLVIAGDGEERKNLINMAESLGLTGHYLMLGSVNHSIMPMFYAIADVVCIPSVVIGNMSADTPISALEGMMCGKVVVASDIGGIKDIIKNGINGILVKQRDPYAIADGIMRVLRDEGLRHYLERNAYATALQGHSSIFAAKIYLKIFERLLGEN